VVTKAEDVGILQEKISIVVLATELENGNMLHNLIQQRTHMLADRYSNYDQHLQAEHRESGTTAILLISTL
jgi:hypothetical protein